MLNDLYKYQYLIYYKIIHFNGHPINEYNEIFKTDSKLDSDKILNIIEKLKEKNKEDEDDRVVIVNIMEL